MFKKPKKTAKGERKVFSGYNDDENDEQMEVDTPKEGNKSHKSGKKVPKITTTLLSFGDDEGKVIVKVIFKE